ncbi:putative nucleic-acid-binding protein [Pseudoloma neurophilia]|uniref:Putative nucleic-acid-binding protein n=1 Tax=Pseudoloma neurophilia TaxID=146866 RepID=A0A0R0LWH2_9MICR|nr:putative nucleic-acid-binding protein [Pseudoloma neurophilia]
MGLKRSFNKTPKVLNIRAQIKKTTPKTVKLENEEPKFDDYFKINHNLSPPYNVLIDTNFIVHSSKKKIDIEAQLKQILLSNIIINIPECVFAELEKMGFKYRTSLLVAKKMKHNTLFCDHKGTYADDCIINRVTPNRCYIVATCDANLKRRIRKIPGVPILYIQGKKYAIESLPVS